MLYAYLSSQPFALADLLFAQAVARLQTPFGGTPSPSTAISLIFAGAALLLAAANGRAATSTSQGLAVLVGLLSLRAVLGYIMGVPELYATIGDTGMSLLTSLLFLALGTGILLLDPSSGLPGLVWRRSFAGVLLRRLVLGMLALLVGGLIGEVLGLRSSLFGPGILLVLLVAITLSLFSWITRSLDRADQARQAAEQVRRADAARLAVLASASRAFAETSADYQTLLNQIAQRMVVALGDFCIIRVLDDDQQTLPAVALYHYDPTDIEARTFIEKLLATAPLRADEPSVDQQVFQTGKPLLVPKIDVARLQAQIKPEYRASIERFRLHSMIVVPLHAQNRAIGLLGLYRSRSQWPAFTEDDLALAHDLADRAALAINTTRLYIAEQAQRQLSERVAARLERLQAVTAALSGAASVAEVAHIIMTQGVDALDAEAGLVALLDATRAELVILDSRGYDPAALQAQQRIALTQPSALTEAARMGRPIWLSDMASQLREYPQLLVLPLSARFQARAAVPLQSGEPVIGVLQLNFVDERAFDAAERRLLEALAAAGAQALARAQLHDRQQRSLHRIRTLRSIDLAILSGQPTEAIIANALDDLHMSVPYQYAFVALTPPESRNTHVVATRDRRLAAIGEVSQPALDPAQITGIFLDSTPRYAPDLAEVTPRTARIEHLLSNGLHGLLTLPLYADGVRVGQLDLLTAQPGAFSDEDQQIAAEVGGQCAIVLRQSQLLAEREQAEERFRLVVEASPSGLILVDTDGRIVLVNAEAERQFGYTRAELLNRPIEQLVPQQFRKVHHGYRAGFGAHPEARAMSAVRDLYGLRKDGSTFPVEIGLNPIQTSAGLHILSAIADITARKQAEAAVRETEQKLSTLFELLPVGVSILDADRNVTYNNPALERIIELPHDQIVAKAYQDRRYIHPDGSAMLPSEFASVRALREQRPVYNIEMGIVKEDSSVTWVSVSAAPVNISGWRVVTVTTDITARKQAEQALLQSEERFSVAFHDSPAAMLITRLSDGQFVDLNASYEHLLGYRHDELVGRTGYETGIYTTDREREEILALLRQHGVLRDHELVLRAKSGQLRTVLCGLERIELNGEPCLIGSIVDITERKQAEQALVLSNQRLQILADASRVFAEAGTDYQTVLDRVARIAGEQLNAGCIVRLLSNDQEWLDLVAIYYHEQQILQELQSRSPRINMRHEEANPLVKMVRSGKPLLLPEMDAEAIRAWVAPDLWEIYTQVRTLSAIGTPLQLRGQVIGCVVFSRFNIDLPPFDEDDLRLAQDLANRAALAIGNVQLLSQVQAELAERERAEAALRQSEARFRSYFELGLVGMAITLPNRSFMDVNDELCTMLGYTKAELLQAKWVDITHPDDLAADTALLNHVLAGDIDGFSRDKRYIHKDGHTISALVSVKGLRHGDSSVNSLLVLIQDITERKQGEQALVRANQRLQILADISRIFSAAVSDYQSLLDDIARVSAEMSGDSSIIRMISKDGHRLPVVALHDLDPEKLALERRVLAGLDVSLDEPSLTAQVAQTQQPTLIPRFDLEQLRSATKPEFLELSEHIGIHSLLLVPIQLSGQVLGVLAWLRHDLTRGPLSQDDLKLAQDLADRAALAISNARLLQEIQHELAERKQAEQALQHYADQLKRLSHQLVEAQEIERRSIAHELHDQVGQTLTGLKLLLDSTRVQADDQLPQQLAEARMSINELLRRVRNLSLDLRPSMLDDLGLRPALKWLLERYTAQTAVQVNWWHQGVERRFPAIIETSVYRIVQEALTNVARHAQVGEVEVRLMADDEQLLVQIDDEGKGFDVEAARQSRLSVGLLGMYERIELLGGTFLIESQPGQGTHLNVTIPLDVA